MFEKSQHEQVVEWVNIVLDIGLSVVASNEDLREKITILFKNAMRLLVRSLCVEDPHKAASVVKDMEIRFPDSTETFLSKFEVLDTQKTLPEVYEDTLMEFVLSVDIVPNIENLLFIMNHLDTKCNVLPSLDYIIANKLSFDDEHQVAFQVLLLRVQLTIEKNISQPIELTEFLTLLERKLESDPPVELVQTISIMVWRKSQQLGGNSPKLASEWLETLNHPLIISLMGDSNVAKVERRLMSLYEEMGEWEKIPQKRDLMAPIHQKDPKTVPYLLAYHLKFGNLEKAVNCLDELCKSWDINVSSILVLCIGKARDMGNEYITVYGMKKIIDTIVQGKSIDTDAINIPAVVRCTLQLQMKSLSAADKPSTDEGSTKKFFLASLEMTKTILDQALKFLDTIEVAQSELGGQIEQRFTNVDILWIASKAYYSAVQAMKMRFTKEAVHLAETALKFLAFETEETKHFEQDDERARLEGICTTLLIFGLWKMLGSQGQVAGLDSIVSDDGVTKTWDRIYQLSQQCQKTWTSLAAIDKKYATDYLPKLLVYELDSCIHLEKWGQVKRIVVKILKSTSLGESKDFSDEGNRKVIECAVDLLLNSPALPLPMLVETLHVITSEKLGSAALLNNEINIMETRHSENGQEGFELTGKIKAKVQNMKQRQQNELEKAIQWIRMIVGLSLPMHEDVCVDILNQFKEFLKNRGKLLGMSEPDIQWIATSCWNQGIYYKQYVYENFERDFKLTEFFFKKIG